MGIVAERRAGDAEFSVRRRGEWAQVTVTGELDLSTADALQDHLDAAMRLRKCPQVLVDVTRMTFCDSSGLNVLLRARKRISALRGRLVLLRPTDRFARVLRTTGLDGVFDIRDASPA
ncbi:MAG TPA: STAS domain-containing protein [Spirillospora sp.]|nr:STAS domain-containing protein [Spirillospora sp.]